MDWGAVIACTLLGAVVVGLVLLAGFFCSAGCICLRWGQRDSAASAAASAALLNPAADEYECAANYSDPPEVVPVRTAPQLPRGLWIDYQGPLAKPSRARRSLSVGLSSAWCERLFVLLSNGELASCKSAAGARCAVFPSVELLSDNKALSLPSKPYAYIGRTGHAVAVRTDSKQAQFAVTTSKRTFTLRAPSTLERDAWIVAINERAAALGEDARVDAARESSAAAERDAPPNWSDATPRAAVGGGVDGLVYTLRPSAVGALARESIEWNMASQQFARLLGAAERARHTVVAVDVIDVETLRRRYFDARAEFSAAGTITDEIWVSVFCLPFHFMPNPADNLT